MDPWNYKCKLERRTDHTWIFIIPWSFRRRASGEQFAWTSLYRFSNSSNFSWLAASSVFLIIMHCSTHGASITQWELEPHSWLTYDWQRHNKSTKTIMAGLMPLKAWTADTPWAYLGSEFRNLWFLSQVISCTADSSSIKDCTYCTDIQIRLE